MKYTKLCVLAALFASAIAGPIRSRLAQAKTDDGGSGGLPECTCELPGEPGSGFPDMGQGEFGSFSNAVAASISQSTDTRPDTAQVYQCESACCSCAVEAHAS